MRYILWVVALLEACDVINNDPYLGRHLLFVLGMKNSTEKALCMILPTRFTFIVENKLKNKCTFPQKWLEHLLLMTSYLVTIKTDHH